jgi:hypothetical protein
MPWDSRTASPLRALDGLRAYEGPYAISLRFALWAGGYAVNRSTGKLARTDVTLTGRPRPGPEPRQDRDAIRWPGLEGSLAQIPPRVGSHRLRPSQVPIQSTYPGFVSQAAADPAEQASEAYSTFNLNMPNGADWPGRRGRG